MTYFDRAGNTKVVLLAGIVIILILILCSVFLIKKNIKIKYLKKIFYLALGLQIVIIIIDNYFYPFPLIDLDAHAFESLGWYSYLTGEKVERGNYNYLFINPIYKILHFYFLFL